MINELKSRTKRLALDVIRLSSKYPRRFELQHIHGQMLRSSSSVAANYRAASRARSRAEFIAKMGLVEEECDETQLWLELLRDGAADLQLRLSPEIARETERLIDEAEQILRITVASKKTAKSNSNR